MKRLIIVNCLLITLLAACSSLSPSSPTPLPTVSLDTTSPNQSSADGLTVSGVVVPLRTAQLSFPAVGRVESVDVKVGDKVTKGQQIGVVGGTGRVTGAHLHWELIVNGVQVNPVDWLENVYP